MAERALFAVTLALMAAMIWARDLDCAQLSPGPWMAPFRKSIVLALGALAVQSSTEVVLEFLDDIRSPVRNIRYHIAKITGSQLSVAFGAQNSDLKIGEVANWVQLNS